MILFLTSSPCKYNVAPATLNPDNEFLDRLRAALPVRPRVLWVCSNPDSYDLTEEFANTIGGAFRDADLPFGEVIILDRRTADRARELVEWCDLMVLSGGHAPTQNAFFQEIRLAELVQAFAGVILAFSAGSMNCAEVVYAQPEAPGESVDPEYRKFLPGLGLTKIQMLPHYQQVWDMMLDGRRLYEDITYPDSMGHVFHAFPDGSYLYRDDREHLLLGKVYRLSNGILEQLTGDGGKYRIKD